jgi:hypothetical protein
MQGQKYTIVGQKKTCGHFCAHHHLDENGFEICCRCAIKLNTPAHQRYWLFFSEICGICRGVLRKHPDGDYYQQCPRCGCSCLSVNKGQPILAPLYLCGNCYFKENQEKVGNLDVGESLTVAGCLTRSNRYRIWYEQLTQSDNYKLEYGKRNLSKLVLKIIRIK